MEEDCVLSRSVKVDENTVDHILTQTQKHVSDIAFRRWV